MRVEIDTHTHTLASGHAYNTLNEMAQAAADKGLKGLAITEHAPEMPGTCHLFYFQNLRIVPRKKYGIELLLGTELNIMNARGEIDLPDSVLERLDIAIASIHMPCFKDERTIDNVTAAYEKVMEHPYVDIIGHPDDGRFPVDMKRLVKKAKETGTLLEVNNSSLRPEGFRENTKENCLEMVKECKAQGVMIVLGSDSHDGCRYCRVTICGRNIERNRFSGRIGCQCFTGKIKSMYKTWEKTIDFAILVC